jgi:hypothetical protein
MPTTFGSASQPNQDTINLDALMSLSLMNYNSELIDQVSASNAFYYEIKPRMQSKSGGVAVKQPLMYALGNVDTYDGYDTVDFTPTEGITQSTWEWRQLAANVMISGKEEIQNENGLKDLLKVKIQQAEMAIQEFWGKRFLQGGFGQVGGTLATAYTNVNNGSAFVDPLGKLVAYDPTASVEVGGINQSTYSWWRNRTLTSAATTEKGFLLEMDSMYNSCSKGGSGGPPNLILVDQKTFELWRSAYYTVYRRTADGDDNYPFPNIKFNKARVVWDEWLLNVADGADNATSSSGKGTAYFLNTKFFTPYYIGSRNFVNTPFIKPYNQDVKTSMILWMGTIGCSQRRKQGVVGNIARSLS